MDDYTNQDWITRAEAGRRLDVSAMMVTKYCQRGLPSRPDKRVNRPTVQSWVGAYVVPWRSGSWRYRMFQRKR